MAAFHDAKRPHRAGRAVLDAHATLATPGTILRWYRELVARKYDGSALRRPGRPPVPAELRARIFGARRAPGSSWKRFLQAHWSSLAATDFFTVEALTWHGLVRLHVLFVIELNTRAVQIAGVVPEPHGAWMMQIARNLLDAFDGFLLGKTHLIMDRGTAFTADFRAFLTRAGVEPLRLPPQSPNLNAYAERFVRSVRTECLDHLVIFGPAHLLVLLREYVEHHNTERPHQGVGNVLVRPPPEPANDDGPVKRRQRLGGLLSYYHRGAA